MEERETIKQQSGFNKIKSPLIIIIALTIVALLIFLSLNLTGFFQHDIPDAGPVIAQCTDPLFRSNECMVWFVFDDGSLFFFKFTSDSENPGVRFDTLFENEISISAMQFMIAQIDTWSTHYNWNESQGVIITGTYYQKLSNSQYQYVLDAIADSNYTEWNSSYSAGPFEALSRHMRIWNETSSKLIYVYADAGPDEFYELWDVLVMREYIDA